MNNTYYPTIGCALVSLRPGADFGVVGNTYSGIDWLSEDQSIPTEDEVNLNKRSRSAIMRVFKKI